jgi:hypothetical protein
MGANTITPPPGFILDDEVVPPKGFVLDDESQSQEQPDFAETIAPTARVAEEWLNTQLGVGEPDTVYPRASEAELEATRRVMAGPRLGPSGKPLLSDAMELGTVPEEGRDIRLRLGGPQGRDTKVERGAKNLANQLLLSDIEQARPSSGMVNAVTGMSGVMDEFQKLEDAGEISPDMSFWKGLKAFPKMWWAMTKGYYSPSSRQEQAEAHEMLRQHRTPVDFDIPAPETTGERMVDAGTGLAAFITRVTVAKRLLPASLNKMPNLQRAMAWEMTNTDGLPGESALMAGTMGALGSLPANMPLTKAGRTLLQSGALSSAVYVRGGDTVDMAIAAMIPPTFGLISTAKGRISDVKMVRSWENAPSTAFIKNVPRATKIRYARTLRAMYNLKGRMRKNTPDTPLSQQGRNNRHNERLYKSFEKAHGQSVDTFLKEANAAFEASKPSGATQIGTRPDEIPQPGARGPIYPRQQPKAKLPGDIDQGRAATPVTPVPVSATKPPQPTVEQPVTLEKAKPPTPVEPRKAPTPEAEPPTPPVKAVTQYSQSAGLGGRVSVNGQGSSTGFRQDGL